MKQEEKQTSRSGYTIIEMLVAVGIFSIVVSVALGSFARALRSQHQAAALLAANSTVGLVTEQLVREMRVASNFCTASSTSCNSSSDLSYINAQNQIIALCLFNNHIRRGVLPSVAPVACSNNSIFKDLTPDSMVVPYLRFTLAGNAPADSLQTRVTISFGVTPKEAGVDQSQFDVQMTVSPRNLDS